MRRVSPVEAQGSEGWATQRAGSPPDLTIDAALNRVTDELSRLRVMNPEHQAGEIIAALLDLPRHWPTTHGDEPADALMLVQALQAAKGLAQGMPFQYAVGRANFRNLTLDVDARVLIPRPETELLVEIVLEEMMNEPGGIAVDVGTGSGAIALALAQEAAFDRVIATDLSLDALAVARYNEDLMAPLLESAVEFRHGSLLDPVAGVRARAIVSNPPYIAFEEASGLPALVRDWEPAVALLSASNGMAVTAQLIRQAAGCLEAGGLLAIEVDARRSALAAEMVSTDGRYRDVSVRLDLAGRERFVIARRRAGSGHP